MSPLTPDALDSLRPRTCAIGLLEVPVEEYTRDPLVPRFAIFRSGFLIGPRLVVTNGHVVARVSAERQKRALPESRRYVSFHVPHGDGFEQSFHEFDKAAVIVEGPRLATPGRLDLGLISFKAEPHQRMHGMTPVTVYEQFDARVGDPVAVYGYPLGTDLLTAGDMAIIYRFGPVLQQGYISAIAPYEHSPRVDRLLLDVRTTNGMSGSPIFDPQTGCVLGIHQAGIGSTVAFGIPLDTRTVAQLVTTHAAAPDDGGYEGKMSADVRPT